MVNTTLIIEVIAIVFLIGIIAYIAFVMFGPAKPDGPPGKCWPGTQYDEAYGGCVSTPLTPVSKSECENGVWKPANTEGTKGICVCESGYFGSKCGKQCDSSVPCKGDAQCINGKCTSKQCKCPDGQTCSSGSKCDTCLPGYGPLFPECKKHFTKPIILFNQCMWKGPLTTENVISRMCKYNFGPLAEYHEVNESPHCPIDKCPYRNDKYMCHVPSYYADASWEPELYNPCRDGTKFSDPKEAWKPPGYIQDT